MKITIHRGTDQIGGCVTEYEHQGYRLFVDYGEQLPGAPKTGPLDIDGLTKGDLSKSALLITHYHGDHIGCIAQIPDGVPIYMGAIGHKIQLTLSQYLATFDATQKKFIDRLEKAKTFFPAKEFSFGPFRVIPVTTDHSAFDAYAFKIEAEGVKVLHTGDFRTHGFRGRHFKEMIDKYIGPIHYVVCEGTNVSKPDATPLTEQQLQKEFENLFRQNKANIVYASSTNIDRIFSLYHSALKANRAFLIDDYQHRMMETVVKNWHIWTKSKLYNYGKYEPIVLKYKSKGFLIDDHLKEILDAKGYVIMARANQSFGKLADQLPGKKTKYLSMWDGYIDENNEAYRQSLAEALGNDYIKLHTSGHCDVKSLHHFFSLLQPKAIIPIHTDQPDEFAKLFSKDWSVLRLRDGDSILLYTYS